MIKRLIASLVCLTLSFSNLHFVYAQDFSIDQLPVPGAMIGESPAFAPLALKGLAVNLNKPLEFQFIVDTGKGPQDSASIKEEANRLVKYFLAGITIPEGELWVNLSPYEKNRITTPSLGQTELGRDLLAQDYILKQLTASLIYPEKDLGKEFWNRVYARAQKEFGTTNVPVNTFNKVWILPDQAQVYENGPAVYITKSTLKIMLDEDYLALQKHTAVRNGTASIGANIVREIVIPEITKEVNVGKNFAPLRQIYDAMILAKWYKETIQNNLLDAIYTDKKKMVGVNLADPTIKEQIYQRYLQAYKKGVFNYIKEDPLPDGQMEPRKYFSGGLTPMPQTLDRGGDAAMINVRNYLLALTVSLVGVAGHLYAGQPGMDTISRIISASDEELINKINRENEAGSFDREQRVQDIDSLYNLNTSTSREFVHEFIVSYLKSSAFLGRAYDNYPNVPDFLYRIRFDAKYELIAVLNSPEPGYDKGAQIQAVYLLSTMLDDRDVFNAVQSYIKRLNRQHLPNYDLFYRWVLRSFSLGTGAFFRDHHDPEVLIRIYKKMNSSFGAAFLEDINDDADNGKSSRDKYYYYYSEKGYKFLYDNAPDKEFRNTIKKLQDLSKKQAPDAAMFAEIKLHWILDHNTGEVLIAKVQEFLGFIKNPRTLHKLFGILGKSDKEKTMALMLKMLGNKNPQVRISAIEALEEMGDPRAIDPILNLVHDKDHYVRMAAIKTLGEMGDPRAIKPILELPVESNFSYYSVLIEALEKLGASKEQMVEVYKKILVHAENYKHFEVYNDMSNLLKSLGSPEGRYKYVNRGTEAKHRIDNNKYGGQEWVTIAPAKPDWKKEERDRAMLPTAENGGIDLNQITIHRTGHVIQMQFNPAQLNELVQGDFEGFTPVIINITPISSPFQLLGVSKHL